MTQATLRHRLAHWLYRRLTGQKLAATITAVIDDSPGWTSHHGRYPHDRDQSEHHQLYIDALDAWRKNPIAWRTIAITTDYTIGQGITITSPHKPLQTFIDQF